MEAKELLLKSLNQSQEFLSKTLDGLTQEEFAWTPNAECNSIAFTLWHNARVEDFFVNRVIKREKELYVADGWQEKMGTPVKAYQFTAEELQAWPVPNMEDLRAYADSVREKTLAFLNSIPDEKLSEVPRPDKSPDPIGITLVMIATELAMHVGQISYLRGMQRGLDK